MKFKIDTEDFWWDEDSSSLEESLKRHITNEVIKEIYDTIKVQVAEQITREVRKEIENRIGTKIKETIKQKSKRLKIYEDGEEISVDDFILKKYQKARDWHEEITNTVKRKGDEVMQILKARYDIAFASQVVARLQENKMLKSGVSKLILKDIDKD